MSWTGHCVDLLESWIDRQCQTRQMGKEEKYSGSAYHLRNFYFLNNTKTVMCTTVFRNWNTRYMIYQWEGSPRSGCTFLRSALYRISVRRNPFLGVQFTLCVITDSVDGLVSKALLFMSEECLIPLPHPLPDGGSPRWRGECSNVWADYILQPTWPELADKIRLECF